MFNFSLRKKKFKTFKQGSKKKSPFNYLMHIGKKKDFLLK